MDSVITSKRVRLRKKKLSDARNDYNWHTDTELVKLDAAPQLTISYTQYLISYVSELHLLPPTSHRFAIDTLDGRHIGNCTYYNVNDTRGEAEVGIMIGDRNYWGKGYGTEIIRTLVNHIFSKTSLNRLYLKTLDWNKRAQQCFAKCGFRPCGNFYREGCNFLLMELLRHQWVTQLQESPPQLDEEAKVPNP